MHGGLFLTVTSKSSSLLKTSFYQAAILLGGKLEAGIKCAVDLM
jgi:hypothetical protein